MRPPNDGVSGRRLGGALGAMARYGLAQGLKAPMGTLVANALGCLAMGLLYGWLSSRPEWLTAWRPFLLTGLLGALTTYSTFSLEALQMWQSGRVGTALGYAVGTLLLSLGSCAVGLWWSRAL